MSVTSMRQSFNFLSLSLFFLLKYATFVLDMRTKERNKSWKK